MDPTRKTHARDPGFLPRRLLNYKGLSNAGTWMIGRLQTERDRERVIEGLVGASGGGLDRGRLREVLGSLGKRMFVLQNAHEPAPILFQTRWALSYLAGPMTRQEIARMMAPLKKEEAEAAATSGAPAAATAPAPAPRAPASPAASSTEPPVLPSDVPQAWLPRGQGAPGGSGTGYRAAVLGLSRMRYVNAKRGIDHREEVALLAEVDADALAPVDWREAAEITISRRDLETEPPAGDASYGEPPAPARDPKSYRGWEKELSDHLYRNRRLALQRSAVLDVLSEPGEDERAFRIRLAPLARAERDRRMAEVEERYDKRLQKADERIRRAEERQAREEGQASERKRDFLISSVASLASVGVALFSRRSLSRATLGRATTAARGFSRARREDEDVEAAAAEVARLKAEREALEAELKTERDRAGAEVEDPASAELEEVELAPRRADVTVDWLGLAWVPNEPA